MVFIYCLYVLLVLPLAIALNVTRDEQGDLFDDIYLRQNCDAQNLLWEEPDGPCVCPYDGTFIGINNSKIICNVSMEGTLFTFLTQSSF